jgi:hypothetical protein
LAVFIAPLSLSVLSGETPFDLAINLLNIFLAFYVFAN